MTSALIVGSSVGAIIGLLHAWTVYTQRISAFPDKGAVRPVAVRANAAYFALWTFFLWVLFGSYVFYLWVISVAIYTIYSAVRRLLNSMPPR
jgi:hypothetical protein